MASKTKVRANRALKRRRRVRGRITGTAEIPRLTIAKSLNNLYLQVIDDVKMVTLLGLGTQSKHMADRLSKEDTKTEQAKKLGQAMAELALEKGISKVVFDRNQFRYHGRIKAAADGAREKGLKF